MFASIEKKYLKKLVEKELEKFKSEEKGVVDISPLFLKGEKEYEEFLKKLIEKLGK